MDKNTSNPLSPPKTKVKKENEEEIKVSLELSLDFRVTAVDFSRH